MIIDTHTHLYLDQFDEDRREVVDRAKARDVNMFLLPNIDVSSIGPLREMVATYPEARGMMGLHPCSVAKDYTQQLRIIESELRSGDYIAVGEIGVDLYWDKTFLDAQQDAFRIQVEWAKELNLPVVLHVRDAFPEIFDLLDELKDDRLRGVFHCFTGGQEEAAKVEAYESFYYGIGGVATFKNGGLDKVIPHLDPKKIILETDSPYLAPKPHRGQRNESAYAAIVAQRVADLLERSVEEVAALTTANALRMFELEK